MNVQADISTNMIVRVLLPSSNFELQDSRQNVRTKILLCLFITCRTLIDSIIKAHLSGIVGPHEGISIVRASNYLVGHGRPRDARYH